MEQPASRIFAAEMFGTAVLMIGGPGSAILAGDRIGILGISLAFGFSLLIMAYAIGHISGCHINPAVTLAMALTRKIKVSLVPVYWLAQFLGALLGGFIIWGIAHGRPLFDSTNNFAQNDWGSGTPNGYGFGAVILVEVIFTAILVAVVLTTTNSRFPAKLGGVAAGLTLALIHLVTIPVDNTSVNPARSFGAAFFAFDFDHVGHSLWRLVAFIVLPMVGAVVGVVAWLWVDDAVLEDTALDSNALRQVRDMGDSVADKAIDAIDG